MGDIEPADKPGTLTTLTRTNKKYPYLLDDAGQWTVRKDVYYYDARVKKGGPLTATSAAKPQGASASADAARSSCRPLHRSQ